MGATCDRHQLTAEKLNHARFQETRQGRDSKSRVGVAAYFEAVKNECSLHKAVAALLPGGVSLC